MNKVKLQVGDLLFERNGTWLARAIQWAGRLPGEPPTYCNHVAGAVGPVALVQSCYSVRFRIFDLKKIGPCQVWRPNFLTLGDQQTLNAIIRYQIGTCYGYTKIGTHFLDALISKVFKKDISFFRKLNRSNFPICSYLWAQAYYNVKQYKFNQKNYWAVSPDDMHDHVKKNTNEWECVVEYG